MQETLKLAKLLEIFLRQREIELYVQSLRSRRIHENRRIVAMMLERFDR